MNVHPAAQPGLLGEIIPSFGGERYAFLAAPVKAGDFALCAPGLSTVE
jgi:hypothetical protein